MRVLLINAPHTAIGSRIPREQLPPLGLLAIGGPLIDAAHEVELLDADLEPLAPAEIARRAAAWAPDAVMFGHFGSTSAHPTILAISRAVRAACEGAWIIYGGVFPTYHWREVLAEAPQIDVIVRGEGEATTPRLLRALEAGAPLDELEGIAYRREGQPWRAPDAPRRPGRSAPMGLQAPGLGHAPHARVAGLGVGQAYGGDDAAAPQGAVARPLPPRAGLPGGDALVLPHRPPGLAPRDRGVPAGGDARGGGPDAGGVLGGGRI